MEELEASLLRVAFDSTPWLIDELDRDELGLARAVERVLPPGDGELVLLIDQFEELFTLVEDEDARARFVDSLVAAVGDPHSRIRVIATLRADFYDRPLLLPGLAEHVRAQTLTVLPLSAEELETRHLGSGRTSRSCRRTGAGGRDGRRRDGPARRPAAAPVRPHRDVRALPRRRAHARGLPRHRRRHRGAGEAGRTAVCGAARTGQGGRPPAVPAAGQHRPGKRGHAQAGAAGGTGVAADRCGRDGLRDRPVRQSPDAVVRS